MIGVCGRGISCTKGLSFHELNKKNEISGKREVGRYLVNCALTQLFTVPMIFYVWLCLEKFQPQGKIKIRDSILICLPLPKTKRDKAARNKYGCLE